MTKKAINVLRGWSIGVGVAVVTGTVAFLSSAKSPSEKAVEDMYINEIIQFSGTDSMQYPSIFDASVITNIPVEDLREAIRTNSSIEGYQFDVKK